MKIKRYIDAIDNAKQTKTKTLNNKRKLLNFYNILSIVKNFEQMTKENFKKFKKRVKNTRKRKRSDVLNLKQFATINYFFSKRIASDNNDSLLFVLCDVNIHIILIYFIFNYHFVIFTLKCVYFYYSLLFDTN